MAPKATQVILNTAFRQLMDGAELIAFSADRYWQKPDGLVLDCGPFVKALEYALWWRNSGVEGGTWRSGGAGGRNGLCCRSARSRPIPARWTCRRTVSFEGGAGRSSL